MTASNAFSAQDWIKEHLHDGVNLDAECLHAVQNFTLMWNLFESLLCGNHANIPAFERIVTRQEFKEIPPFLLNLFSYFRSRYVSHGKITHLLEMLRFRRNDRRDFVEKVLKQESSSPAEIVLSLMIIIYRLRNNLFHGLKSASSLNNQTKNLDVAARALAIIIDIQGHHSLVRSNYAASR